MYNFYIFILISLILKVLIISLKKDILMEFNVLEESVLGSIGILIGMLTVYLYIYGNLNKLREKLYNSSKSVKLKLLFFIVFVVMAIIVGGMVLIRENIGRFVIFKDMLYIILIILVSVLYYKKSINMCTIFGLILIMTGLYMVDGHLSKEW